jgi:hypothetical protein
MAWAADYKAVWHGGVLILQITGLLTASRLQNMRLEVKAALMQRSAVKVLMDIRRAVVTFGDGQIPALVRAECPDVSMAILVDPAQAQTVRNYAKAMREAGHTRLVFTSLSPALREWLAVPVPELKELRAQPVAPLPPSLEMPPGHMSQ